MSEVTKGAEAPTETMITAEAVRAHTELVQKGWLKLDERGELEMAWYYGSYSRSETDATITLVETDDGAIFWRQDDVTQKDRTCVRRYACFSLKPDGSFEKYNEEERVAGSTDEWGAPSESIPHPFALIHTERVLGRMMERETSLNKMLKATTFEIQKNPLLLAERGQAEGGFMANAKSLSRRLLGAQYGIERMIEFDAKACSQRTDYRTLQDLEVEGVMIGDRHADGIRIGTDGLFGGVAIMQAAARVARQLGEKIYFNCDSGISGSLRFVVGPQDFTKILFRDKKNPDNENGWDYEDYLINKN